jgi:hypothetical protein
LTPRCAGSESGRRAAATGAARPSVRAPRWRRVASILLRLISVFTCRRAVLRAGGRGHAANELSRAFAGPTCNEDAHSRPLKSSGLRRSSVLQAASKQLNRGHGVYKRPVQAYAKDLGHSTSALTPKHGVAKQTRVDSTHRPQKSTSAPARRRRHQQSEAMAARDASPPRQTLRRRHRSSGSLDDFCDDRSPSPLPHIHRNRWVATFTYITNCAAGWALTKLFVSIVEQSRYGLGVFLLTLLPRLNRLSHLVLRWPLLVLVYALVGVELILYFLLRTLVAALELAVASPTHRRLRSALRRADDYAQWLACARALDASRGVALWQADLRSTRYNWPFVRRLRARLRTARSQNDWRGVADTLRLCSRPNVGGIMAPELFAVSYAGAPKIVVTDFVDEVCSQRP